MGERGQSGERGCLAVVMAVPAATAAPVTEAEADRRATVVIGGGRSVVGRRRVIGGRRVVGLRRRLVIGRLLVGRLIDGAAGEAGGDRTDGDGPRNTLAQKARARRSAQKSLSVHLDPLFSG